LNQRLVRWLAIGSLPILLSGCVAAAIPVVAGGMIARTKLKHKEAANPAPTAQQPPHVVDTGDGKPAVAMATGLRTLPAPDGEANRAGASASADVAAFIQFATDEVQKRRLIKPRPSVVLVKDVDVAQPAFVACRPQEPLAVLIDIDGGDAGLTPDVLAQLRTAGLQIIWLSGRDVAEAVQLKDQLAAAGLMAAAEDHLSLKRGADDRKQLQRLDVAHDYCLVAIVGHKRGDFDELFDYVRQEESLAPLKSLWNHGWFLLPPKQQ